MAKNYLYVNQDQSMLTDTKKVTQLEEKIKVLEKHISESERFLDFSQLGEQQVLLNIIERISSRRQIALVYLDIGAYHPIAGSNTFQLARKYGWSGVVVEPNPEKLKYWGQLRPMDKSVCAAVIPDSWSLDSVMMECENNNDARESVVKELNLKNRHTGKNLLQYEAMAIRFQDLMAQCKAMALMPSLLNLDIEGLEQEIILGSEITKYNIAILCIEHFLNEFTDKNSIFEYQNSRLVRYLEENNYHLVSICGVSLIFCHADYWVPYA